MRWGGGGPPHIRLVTAAIQRGITFIRGPTMLSAASIALFGPAPCLRNGFSLLASALYSHFWNTASCETTEHTSLLRSKGEILVCKYNILDRTAGWKSNNKYYLQCVRGTGFCILHPGSGNTPVFDVFFLIPQSQWLPPIPHTNNLLHALTSTNRKLPLFINW